MERAAMNSFSQPPCPPNLVPVIRSVLDVFQTYRGPIERGTFIPLKKKIRKYVSTLGKLDRKLVSLAIDWLVQGEYLVLEEAPLEPDLYRAIFFDEWDDFDVVLRPTDKLWKLAEEWPRDVGPTPANERGKRDEGPSSVEKPPTLEGQPASPENRLTLEEDSKELSDTQKALLKLAAIALQAEDLQELMTYDAKSAYEKIQNLPAEKWPAELEDFKLPSLSTFRGHWSRIRKKLGCLQRQRHLPPPDCRSAIRPEEIDQRSKDWD